MEILRSLRALGRWRRGFRAPVGVAIGAFDGVHIGHQYLLRTLHEWAQDAGGRAVAMTFEPHPLAVLSPAHAPKLLTSLDDKLALFAGLGLDAAAVIGFTPEFAALTPDEFMQLVIHDVMKASYVIVGFNFTFGALGKGTPNDLVVAGPRLGFETVVAPPVCVGDVCVSSTTIRAAVSRGAVEEAMVMLGRPFWLPLAPFEISAHASGLYQAAAAVDSRFAIPKAGVYAARLRMDGRTKAAAVLISRKADTPMAELATRVAGRAEGGIELWARLPVSQEDFARHAREVLAYAEEKLTAMLQEDDRQAEVPGPVVP